MQRKFLAAGLLALAFSLAACGGDRNTTDTGADPAAGTCLEGTPDCDDTGILDGSAGGERCLPEAVGCNDTPDQEDHAGDVFDSGAAIAQAQGLLGLVHTELAPDVRVGRQGEEWMILTKDYRLGRMTVELDINDMDEWIVTAVTVELPDGPRTVTRHLQ